MDELYADPAALQAYQALSTAGGRVFIVGGAVRDALLGKRPKDVDLMVAGLTQDQIRDVLKDLPGKMAFAGKAFGVFHYSLDDYTVEIAMPRTEKSTGPGHQDFAVTVDHTLPVEEDLARRDFTANAMAFDIAANQLIDPFDGEGDIKKSVLRLINDRSFVDDPLRIVRALVSFSVHGLEPDPYTLDQMEANAARIKNLPPDRIRDELDKLISGNDPVEAFLLAYDTGLLSYLVPELDAAMGFDQNNIHHDLDVGMHSLAVLDAMAGLTTDPDLRLAALLHDLGKPDSMWQDEEGNGHFYQHPDYPESINHEELGADIAYNFMKRLNYKNSRINRVVALVRNHMFPYFTSEAGARRLLNSVGGDTQLAQDLLLLRESDASGKNDRTLREDERIQIDLHKKLLQSVIDKEQAVGTKDLAIGGNDILALGVSPGPKVGEILKQLVELIIEDPTQNERETLLEYVRTNLLEGN